MINTVTADQIKKLNPAQLTSLLLRLLYAEHRRHNFPDVYISVPENINRADGGEDGRIQTSDTKSSQWVYNKDTLYQSKASKMDVSKCRDEVLTSKKKLKPRVQEILNKKGTYVLFTTHQLVGQDLDDRIDGLREGIKEGCIIDGASEVDADKYSQKADIRILDANLIKDWTNQYITAVAYVQASNGNTRPLGLLVWEEFSSYFKEGFKTNEELDRIIAHVRGWIFEGKHVRIEGASGIGKSRLICEIFDPGVKDGEAFDLVRKTLSENMAYIDIAQNHTEVLNYIRSHASDMKAILVLDNCSPDIHEEFKRECDRRDTQIQLVSLDFDRLTSRQALDTEVIYLKSEFYKSVTREILTEKYSGDLTETDIGYLIDFSEGNTKMAKDFAEATIREENLHEMLDDQLIKKLIFGRNPIDEGEFKVLKLLAIFKIFEFPKPELFVEDRGRYDRLLEGTEFLANFFGIAKDYIEKTITKYQQRGNIERRGNLILMRPNPLALKLAILFWDEIGLSRGEEFITAVPKSLQSNIANQLKNLKGVQNAENLVARLWGFDGNFSTAEILNSRMGSHLFRAVVIVNPEATTKTLIHHYLNKPKAELEAVKEGRQNLIWALERLCFRANVFYDAARVLMSFAVAENEFFYSNNATSYLKQLFSFQLAGTEVPYSERIPVLQWALDKQDPDFDLLTLETCASVLKNTMNHRMIGAEDEGGGVPLKDYRPKNMQEVYDYIDVLIAILKSFLDAPEPLRKISQKAIVGGLMDLDRLGYDCNSLRPTLEDVVEQVVDKKELLSILNIAQHSSHSSTILKELANEMIQGLAPRDLADKFQQIVSEPFEYNRGADHKEQEENAQALAMEIEQEDIDMVPYLEQLLSGNQHMGYKFGQYYGKAHGHDAKLIRAMEDYLLKIDPSTHWNSSFLSGYTNSLTPGEQQEIFDHFIERESQFAFVIFQELRPQLLNAKQLLRLANSGIDAKMFRFARRELSKLPIHELIEYFEEMEASGGAISGHIIKIIYWYLRNHTKEELLDEKDLLSFLYGYIERNNALRYYLESQSTDLYEWEEVMNYLLTANSETAVLVAENIAAAFRKKPMAIRSDYHIANVANSTLDANFDEAWPIYAEFLLKSGEFLIFSEIFDMNWLMGSESSHPFFKSEERLLKLKEWLVDHKEAACWVIRFLPLYDQAGDWFSVTKKLIDTFGNDSDFRAELSSNLHSMSTVGSRVPYLESRIRLLEKLKEHHFQNVREWALKEIEAYEKEIKLEKIRDEEDGLR